MRKRFAAIMALAVSFHTPLGLAGYTDEDDPTPDASIGAKVFAERCVLCHGNQGMGEGPLPLKVKPYPKTNLMKPVKAFTPQEILDVIAYGGSRENISVFMPPFGKEITWTEVESAALFVSLLRTNREAALALLNVMLKREKPSQRLGQEIFSTRCVLCHGVYGEGDGRMAKILKAPPPADLTASRLPDAYLQEIIRKGGEGVGRSKHMPPWGDQLSTDEITSVILFLKTIRD